MGYYNKCDICGNNLDPGEVCDCNGVKPSDEDKKGKKKKAQKRDKVNKKK